jgi:hypothetical protein
VSLLLASPSSTDHAAISIPRTEAAVTYGLVVPGEP